MALRAIQIRVISQRAKIPVAGLQLVQIVVGLTALYLPGFPIMGKGRLNCLLRGSKFIQHFPEISVPLSAAPIIR
jgi:hypothetical protein